MEPREVEARLTGEVILTQAAFRGGKEKRWAAGPKADFPNN